MSSRSYLAVPVKAKTVGAVIEAINSKRQSDPANANADGAPALFLLSQLVLLSTCTRVTTDSLNKIVGQVRRVARTSRAPSRNRTRQC